MCLGLQRGKDEQKSDEKQTQLWLIRLFGMDKQTLADWKIWV